MKQREKVLLCITTLLAIVFGVNTNSNAMHIMEGYISPGYSVLWGLVSLPFLIVGYLSIKRQLRENPRTISLLAISGAFIFVISSLKIPSVTGSCSHMTGTGLGAILFGASSVSVLGIIVLIFQALLLAHGGITTLGANTFSMAIAGPFACIAVYKLCGKFKVKKHLSVFLAVLVGDVFTYIVTSLQLAIAHPSEAGGILASATKFLAVFAPTQVPLAVIEGIISVVIIMGLETYAKSELRQLGYLKGGAR